MNVVIFGASGMVGQGVLRVCLEDPEVASVLVIGRTPCGLEHPKVREVLHDDFFDYSALESELGGLDACFFCLGVSAAGLKEAEYQRLTHDLTLAAARTLVRLNPEMTFCYVSGAGTDSSEKGRIMWARVKGATENRLLELPFEAAYMFRPGYIQPGQGIRSKTALYRLVYNVLGPVYPLLERLFPNQVTTTEIVGRAMIAAARDGHSDTRLEARAINALGG